MTIKFSDLRSALESWDPQQDVVLLKPEQDESAYWVGCPEVLVEDERVLLTARSRRPRAVENERGWKNAIYAVGKDLSPSSVRECSRVVKRELGTSSIERTCLRHGAAGYEWYVSYVDPADSRWRIDRVTAPTVEGLSVAEREPVFTAGAIDEEGAKDPRVIDTPRGEYMLLSVARAKRAGGAVAASHATQDIYNTADAKSLTGLAKRQGDGWTYLGIVFAPSGDGWDRNAARISTAILTDRGYLGLYDGESTFEHNYEELAGLALSDDLKSWQRLTPDGPYKRALGKTDSLRYCDLAVIDDRLTLFYEISTPAGGHELRAHALL